jgi:superfamily II DNA or RNA helicase
MTLTPGTIVRTRGARHIVVHVEEHGACRSVRLAATDGSGEAMTVLHPFDCIDLLPAVNWPRRAGRRRVARACAAAVRASYEAGQTRTLVDARVRLLPYQLEPALAILRGEATRVLLADEVGLGKTIQAGLILSELRARQMLRRALILTPAGLREQWAAELRERFGLQITIVDAGSLGALQRALPPWVNPWTLPGIAVASIDLLKRDELLPQLQHVVWDAVVVDEAHHATRGTERHQVAGLACSRARLVVLITATPHNGDRLAFEELRALGCIGNADPPLRVFRRSRADMDAGPAERRTRILRVRRTAAEARVDSLLRAYTSRVWREAGADGRLAMVVLRKRALSGAASLTRSLARRLERLGLPEQPDEPAQLTLEFADTLGGELIDDDREPSGELSARGLADQGTERQLLHQLVEAAREIGSEDSKAARLISMLLVCQEPVIVFTEYRDTLEDLRLRLEDHVALTELHGAMMPAERQRSLAMFESGRARVLLATDAAAEGLNLQQRCRWIVHYEVPWNPVRIEQRNGRVDRIGQTRRVHAWHLVAEATEEEDVLARLATRSAIAARDLGDEHAVAAVVFGERPLKLGSPTRRRRRTAGRAVAAEARRVALLRALPPGLVQEPAPLSVRLARRRAVLAVMRAMVIDGHARPLAAACAAGCGPVLAASKKGAARALGRRARQSLAVHASFLRTWRARAHSIRELLEHSLTSSLQPSLFDRRVLMESEHGVQERKRALDELAPPGHEAAATVRLSLVGALTVKRL